MSTSNLGVNLSQYRDLHTIIALIKAACARQRPSLIHTYHLFSDIYAARAAHDLGIGVVRTVAGVSQASWTDPYLRSAGRTRWDPLDIAEELSVEPFVEHTLAVSEATRRMLCDHGFDPDKVSVSYLGTQVDVMPHPRVVRQERRSSPITIGFPHRLEPVKVGPAILPALELLAKKEISVRVVLIQSGRLFDSFRMAALEMGIDVIVVPITPNLWSSLPPLDCVVLASVSEGLPLVMIEAMARGIPVVASRVGGVEEAITHGVSGLLFDCNSAMELAGHILTIAHYPDVASVFVNAGLQTVKSRFDMRRHLLDLAAFYRRIALEPRGKI